MPSHFSADRIVAAVRELESRSAAELVVEIRARSGSYAHADGRFAALLTFVSLVVLVYMPIVVPPVAILLDVVAVYVLGHGIARRSMAVRRLFSTRRERLAAVRTHAAALFHDRGVANTAAETGVLLYASLLERKIELLADRAMLQAVAASEWNALLDDLHRQPELDEETILSTIRTLAAILERAAPAEGANADELPNAVALEVS
jgi:putative membrane protein